MSDDMVCVGSISGAYGVRGEVRLKSFCSQPEAIAAYAPLTTEDGSRKFDIRLGQSIKGGFTARLSGVETKEDADAMKGASLFAPRARLPELPDDEFYHTDLIGLLVLDTGGNELGRVKAVHNHGADDLLEIAGASLKNSVLLPFTKAAVPTVDVPAGRLIADPPEGLI